MAAVGTGVPRGGPGHRTARLGSINLIMSSYYQINNLKKSGFYKSSLDEVEVQVVVPAAAK